MRQLAAKVYELLVEFANNFGIVTLVTVLSMIARSIYKGTSIKRLLLKMPISAVIGFVIGVLLREYTDVSSNTVIAVCSIVGAYSGEVLDGLEQLFQWLPTFIKSVFKEKFNIKNDNENEPQ